MYVKNSRQHFAPDEQQDERQALLKVVKPMKNVFNDEKQGPQSHHREDVGSKDDERVFGYGERGRHGINRESDVCGFHEQHNGEQQREAPFALLPDDKFAAVVVGGKRQEFLGQFENFVMSKIHMFFFFVAQQLDAGIDQDRSEDIEDPVKLGHQKRSGCDKYAAEHNRAHNFPNQYPVMKLFFHPEIIDD